ncbi:MAG: endonuclease/exonuclease/phosphatase family protein [Ferruginibacter sp.]
MKIATWNIERPSNTSKRIPSIVNYLKNINADIFILTETNEFVNLGEDYKSFHTSKPTNTFYQDKQILYKDGEIRVSIFSKYNCVGELATFRSDTSICKIFTTPHGELAVYGTIVGIFGNRQKDFITELDLQIIDFNKIASTHNLCIAGDLNMSFSDNYYFTKEGREKLNKAFDASGLINQTACIPHNIDHIIYQSILLQIGK